MSCEVMRELFAARLGGTLAHDTAIEVERHLSACTACSRELRDLERIWAELSELPSGAVHSNRMRERFTTALAAERAATGSGPASLRSMRRAWYRPERFGGPLAQSAVAASLLLLGIGIGRATTTRSEVVAARSGELSDVRTELRDLRQMLTLSLLQQQSASERLRGVNWTAQIAEPGNEVVAALLGALLHDPNVNVRLSAVDALRRFSDRPEVRQGTRQAVTDKGSPLLQVAVIDFMVESNDPQASELLESLAQDTGLDALVRERARWGVERLAS